MTTRGSTDVRLAHAARLAAAGLIAAGAMILTASPGNAIPESTIISDCDNANGGTYTTVVHDGKRYSKCCYRDINGTKECDNYVDGTYIYTTASLEQPTSTSPPPPPPGGVVGPVATEAERQPTPPPAQPDFGGATMTLWMPPPPPGPAGPPGGEAVLVP